MLLLLAARIFFAGTDGGVFLSTNNGTSWTAVNTGLTDTDVYALAVSGTNLFAGTVEMASFFPLTTAQVGLRRIPGYEYWYLFLLPLAVRISLPELMAGVFLSTNNGTSWTAVNTGLTNTDVRDSCCQRHESFCRDLWWCLSFHQQRHKLDCGQYRLDEYLCPCSCSQRHESLCRN